MSCIEKTTKGTQCSRKATTNGRCSQHHQIYLKSSTASAAMAFYSTIEPESDTESRTTSNEEDTKSLLGQFFTTNCEKILKGFSVPEEYSFAEDVGHFKRKVIEPFAGEGHLISHYNLNQAELEAYDIDPKKEFVIKKDTFLVPPSFKNKFIITNPPYLAKNKSQNKEIFEKYKEDDLYKCFLRMIINDKCLGGILILPINFLCSSIFKDFIKVYKILGINIFEERVFDDTSSAVLSLQFQCQTSDEDKSINMVFYPSEKIVNFTPNEENNYIFGGEIYKLPTNGRYKVFKGNSKLVIKCLDDAVRKTASAETESSRIRMELRENIFEAKSSDRAYLPVVIEPPVDYEMLVDKFNTFLNEAREKYHSMFLSNFREGNRKRLDFTLAYTIIGHLLNDETSEPQDTFGLFEECLKKYSLNILSEKMNVGVSALRRWKELKSVPSNYTFDFLKILSREINYSDYSFSEKDQFFTSNDIVEKYWNTFLELTEINPDDYIFVEPSAGNGSFLKILPPNTIAMDVEPRGENIVKQDFLSWHPIEDQKKYIVFGNPPFGLRGHTALKFINHSSTFADYVCFILPQLFESDGKGSPRGRIIGYNLIFSESFSAFFQMPDEEKTKINCVFQIWSKETSNNQYLLEKQTSDSVKVYSLSDGGASGTRIAGTASSTRNRNMLNSCDVYLPSTCFGKENMKLCFSFEELPNRKGYGLVFLKNKEELIEKAKSVDWSSVSFLSTNSAYNLRTSLILSQFRDTLETPSESKELEFKERVSKELDQFYTRPEIAKYCIEKFLTISDFNNFDVILEPSAGKGSFYNLLPNEKRLGIDIEPKAEGIIKQDFFTFTPIIDKKYLVIGNPPFGRVSSLAVKFFNKASDFCDMIAFIIPRTFNKVSVQNRLNLNFHLVYNEDLPLKPCSFEFSEHSSGRREPEMTAKCCFQIWVKGSSKRLLIIQETEHPDFSFVKPEEADFAMRAYGSNCGEIDLEMKELTIKNWHWVKANINKEELIRRFKSLDFSESKNTVRQDSLGQKDLISLYIDKFTSKREVVVMETEHSDFSFTDFENCDFAVRRNGVNSGKLYDKSSKEVKVGECNWYWIKSNKLQWKELWKRFETLDFSICEETVNHKSLSKGELVHIYKEAFDE